MPSPSDYDDAQVLPLMEMDGKALQQSVGADGRGHAYFANLQPEDNRPRLESRNPPKALGLGGTEVGAERRVQQPHVQAQRPLTPEEMMDWANKQEQYYLDQTRQVEREGSRGSALGAMLDQPSPLQKTPDQFGKQFEPQGPPDWLQQYMERQPFTDPYHQVPPGRVDIINNNKYLSEREKLRMLKEQQASR